MFFNLQSHSWEFISHCIPIPGIFSFPSRCTLFTLIRYSKDLFSCLSLSWNIWNIRLWVLSSDPGKDDTLRSIEVDGAKDDANRSFGREKYSSVAPSFRLWLFGGLRDFRRVEIGICSTDKEPLKSERISWMLSHSFHSSLSPLRLLLFLFLLDPWWFETWSSFLMFWKVELYAFGL